MQPGQLNKRIGFYIDTTKEDEIGGKIKTKQLYKTLWSFEKQLRLSEKARAGRVTSEIIYTFIVRERKDINNTMYILKDDKYLNIEAIVPLVNNKGYMEITGVYNG